MIEPREYQLEALESVNAFHRNGITRQLISLPTGTGKTVIFALLAKAINTRTLIIAHTEELINQAEDKLKIVWPEASLGIVKADTDESEAQIVIASIQTASRDKRLAKLKQHGFDLLIIDEAHHSAASSYHKVVKELGFLEDNPNKLLVGVTATPKRGDGIGLGAIFQEIVFERSIGTMIRAGYLAPLLGKQVITKVHLDGVEIRHGDYVVSELARAINTHSRNQLIVDNYRKYAGDRKKALAFCVDVKHANDLSDLFNAHGIASCAVYGAMNKEVRRQSLSDFKNGRYRVLTNCQILTEGFDEPEVDCVIMSRPTQSVALFTQMIGRGTRTFPTKRDCLILDFCDNSTRNDICTHKNTLDGDVAQYFDLECDDMANECVETFDREISDSWAYNEVRVCQEQVQDIEFFDSAQFAWVPVGDSWHLSLGSNRDIWVRQVNGGFLVVAQSGGDIVELSNRPLPLDYAIGVAEDWSRKQTTQNAWLRKDAPWRTQPASQKQLETLAKLGIEFDCNISKGGAALLLDRKFNEPATERQVFWLKKRGITCASITKREARKLIKGCTYGE